MTERLQFEPSPYDERIKLIRKLRWIGLEKETRDLDTWLSRSETDELFALAPSQTK